MDIKDLHKNLKARLKFYQKKIECAPKDYKPQLNLGKFYLRLGQPKEALPPLIWSQNLAPDIFETNYYLAQGYFLIGQLEKSLFFAKKSFDLNPADKLAKSLYQKIKVEIKYTQNKEQAILKGILSKNNLDSNFKKITKKRVDVINEVDSVTKINPYDFCDGYCRSCKFKKTCSVYQKKIKFEKFCSQNGQDPEDIDVVIKEVEKMIDSFEDGIEEKIRSLGIELRLVNKKDLHKENSIHRRIVKTDLFKRVTQFAKTHNIFLDKVILITSQDSMLGIILQDELEKITHYSWLCESKIYQALELLLSGNNNPNSSKRAMIFLAITNEALNICQNSLNLIMEIGETEWTAEALIFITGLQEMQNYLIENYPEIKNYRKNIIINSDYENKFTR